MLNTTPAEASGIFDIHSRFLTTLHRISLSPHILHIDRIRTEKADGNIPAIDRSARAWAASLTDAEGKVCNVMLSAEAMIDRYICRFPHTTYPRQHSNSSSVC
jgi:hypothetical protein